MAFRSGASRRKGEAPAKLKIALKGLTPKGKKKSDESEDEDNIPDARPLPGGNVIGPDDSPVKKKGPPPTRIDTSVLDNVGCTACGRQLNPYKGNSLWKHPELKVIICKKCEKFLRSGTIAKDEDGIDEQCRWCGEGGNLVVCDRCPTAFCKACVMRNFNRSEWNRINDQDSWACYLCDKKTLQPLRENYRNVRDTLKALQARDKEREKQKSSTASMPQTNGTKRPERPQFASPSSSSSSSPAGVKNISQSLPILINKDSKKGVVAEGKNDVFLCASDLHVEEECVDVVMDKLSTATGTFKEMLRALRSQFQAPSPCKEDGDSTVPLFNFALSSSMSVTEKKRRCTKALNSSLYTFVKSLKTILAKTESFESEKEKKSSPVKSSFKSVKLVSPSAPSKSSEKDKKTQNQQSSSKKTVEEDIETISLSSDSDCELDIQTSKKKNITHKNNNSTLLSPKKEKQGSQTAVKTNGLTINGPIIKNKAFQSEKDKIAEQGKTTQKNKKINVSSDDESGSSDEEELTVSFQQPNQSKDNKDASSDSDVVISSDDDDIPLALCKSNKKSKDRTVSESNEAEKDSTVISNTEDINSSKENEAMELDSVEDSNNSSLGNSDLGKPDKEKEQSSSSLPINKESDNVSSKDKDNDKSNSKTKGQNDVTISETNDTSSKKESTKNYENKNNCDSKSNTSGKDKKIDKNKDNSEGEEKDNFDDSKKNPSDKDKRKNKNKDNTEEVEKGSSDENESNPPEMDDKQERNRKNTDTEKDKTDASEKDKQKDKNKTSSGEEENDNNEVKSNKADKNKPGSKVFEKNPGSNKSQEEDAEKSVECDKSQERDAENNSNSKDMNSGNSKSKPNEKVPETINPKTKTTAKKVGSEEDKDSGKNESNGENIEVSPEKSTNNDNDKSKDEDKAKSSKKDSGRGKTKKKGKSTEEDEENIAAKFDLIKELADEMMQDSDEMMQGDSNGDVSEEEGEGMSDGKKKKDTKKSKLSLDKSKKEQDKTDAKDNDEKDDDVDEASSSDVLMSSDDDAPLASSHKKKRRGKPKDRNETSKEDTQVKRESRGRPKKAVNGDVKNDEKKSNSKNPSQEKTAKDSKNEKENKAKDNKKEKDKVKPEKKSVKRKDSDSEEDISEDEKEIEKLSKLPVMRKRKANDKEDEESDKKKDDVAKPSAKKSKIGPKSSKKNYDDLSSDENDGKKDDDEEDEEDDDMPAVTFGVEPDNDSDIEEIDPENEEAKNGLLDELESDADSEDDKDSDDGDDDSDVPSKSKKKGKKEAAKKEKKGRKSNEIGESDEDDSDVEIGKKKKQIKSKLLDTNLSDSDSDIGKKKKKGKKDDDDFKASDASSDSSDSDDASGSGSDDEDSDDDFDSDESTSKKKGKKSKTKKGKGKKTKKKKGKKGKKGTEEDDESDNEDKDEDSDDEGGGKKGKAKKRRRIKMRNSSSEESEDPEKAKKKKGSGSDDDDDDEEGTKTPGHRKKIRRMISKKGLEDSTKAAAKAEEKRRKRIANKQREFNRETINDDNNPMNVPITTKLILEPGKEEGDPPIVQVNTKLVRKLKPHQVDAVQFMWDCLYESVKRTKKGPGAGCILAHCMGLGKTLSVVSFVNTILSHEKVLGQRTCLVVSPLNTVLNWQNECKMWLDKKDQQEVWELSSVKQNNLRAKTLKEWYDKGGIMIIGYEMYRNLTTGNRIKNKKQKKIIADTLVDPGPDLTICDEGHILKNENSAMSKAMNRMKTRRRVVLTGTPLQNNLVEYHCMLSFVKPSLLGTRKEFTNRFINPILNGQCTDSTSRDVKIMKARAHVLHEMLAGCVQRRDYSALTKFLPPKQEYVMSVRLTDVQIDLYNRYLELSGQGQDGVFNNKGARLFKDYQNLMKIWTHPWVLKLAEIRDELKRQYDSEDSFIDNSSEEERSLSSSESSSDSSVMSDSGGEGTSKKQGAGQKKGTRRTRAKARRAAGEDSDPEEVISEWKSKTRNGEADDDVIELPQGPDKITKEWWAEFVKEEDKGVLELSNKLYMLFEILKMCEEIGDKVLIFSQSILSLNIIENFLEDIDSKLQKESDEKKAAEEEEGVEKKPLDEEDPTQFGRSWTKGLDYYRMDGSTGVQNRQACAEAFNDIENYRARLFLISTKAGGLGINLVAANRVIIFDASWNPSHDVQSIFRVYRFGQTKPCYIYRFLGQGTMEEKIYERQIAKLSLSQRVVDEHQIERHFSSNDLKELYNFKPDRWGDGTEKPTLALPKDPLLAEVLTKNKHCVSSFHEHDSLLENQIEQTLTEEEKKAAWDEYENEKKGIISRAPGMSSGNPQTHWSMMAAAQVLSREQITATVMTLRQQLPDVPEDLFQLHVQQALRRMVQLRQEEMRRMEMLRMQEMNQYLNMFKQGAGGEGMSAAQSMQALHQMQSLASQQGNPWNQIQRLRAMQSQMLQGSMGGGAAAMMGSHPNLMNQLMGAGGRGGEGGSRPMTSLLRNPYQGATGPQVQSNTSEEAIDLDASPAKSKSKSK